MTGHDPKKAAKSVHPVFKIMCSGRWLTLSEIGICLNLMNHHLPEQSISARVRDLRKPKYGGHTITRRATKTEGVFEYQLTQKKA